MVMVSYSFSCHYGTLKRVNESIEFLDPVSTVLRHRPKKLTLEPESSSTRAPMDLESLMPLPTPRIMRPRSWMPTPKHGSTGAITPPKNYSPNNSFISSTVNAVADTVAWYAKDSGGERELLLPISKAEREEADSTDF